MSPTTTLTCTGLDSYAGARLRYAFKRLCCIFDTAQLLRNGSSFYTDKLKIQGFNRLRRSSVTASLMGSAFEFAVGQAKRRAFKRLLQARATSSHTQPHQVPWDGPIIEDWDEICCKRATQIQAQFCRFKAREPSVVPTTTSKAALPLSDRAEADEASVLRDNSVESGAEPSPLLVDTSTIAAQHCATSATLQPVDGPYGTI